MGIESGRSETKAWLEGILQDACAGPENTLQNETGDRAWDTPLVGFARGDDPLWGDYKEHVGTFHWTPHEVFAQAFPESDATPEALVVVSWVLPQAAGTRADNRRQRRYPADRWARSRIFGEAFNVRLRQHVVQVLADQGYEAVAPVLAPGCVTMDSERFVWASTWSERHAAYAAGLGTFGLCDGLITAGGKAMRVGSVVAHIDIDATPRPYTDHHAYCLFYAGDGCDACMRRCPVGAISASGHDKLRCKAHLRTTEEYVRTHFGFEGYGCGLCQTGVPCEAGIPVQQGAG
jgi:epoxyqueuosine reductase QueG